MSAVRRGRDPGSVSPLLRLVLLAALPPAARWRAHGTIRSAQLWPQRRHVRPLAVERRTCAGELTRNTTARPTTSPVQRRPPEPPHEDNGQQGQHSQFRDHHDDLLLPARRRSTLVAVVSRVEPVSFPSAGQQERQPVGDRAESEHSTPGRGSPVMAAWFRDARRASSSTSGHSLTELHDQRAHLRRWHRPARPAARVRWLRKAPWRLSRNPRTTPTACPCRAVSRRSQSELLNQRTFADRAPQPAGTACAVLSAGRRDGRRGR